MNHMGVLNVTAVLNCFSRFGSMGGSLVLVHEAMEDRLVGQAMYSFHQLHYDGHLF